MSIHHWKQQLRLMCLGQAILMAVMAMSLPYWPLYIASFQVYSPMEIRYWSAAIYIAPFITSTFSSPFWGRLGDQYGYKTMVLRACLGLFATQLLILCARQVEWIFIIRLLQGLLAGFIVSAQAWALSITPANCRGEVIGKLQSATAIGNLLGPLSGGVIATYLGYHAIFTLSTVICAMVLIAFFYLLDQPQRENKEKIAEKGNRVSLLKQPYQAAMMFLFVISMIQIARSMVTPFFSLFVQEKLAGNDIAIGVLYAATGLMIFISAPIWGKFFDKHIKNKAYTLMMLSFLLFITCVIQALHVIATSLVMVLVLRLLWGICLGAVLPVFLRLLVDQSDDLHHGIYLGWGNSATKFGNLIGIVLGAMLESHLGFNHSFIMIAVLYFICGSIVFAKSQYENRLRYEEHSLEKQSA